MNGLGPPAPEYLTGVGGRRWAVRLASAPEGLDESFAADRPRAVVVQGDTNAALSGALLIRNPWGSVVEDVADVRGLKQPVTT
ncbi:hypothetical protein ACFY40_27890 [Streptomyces sp. NPDC012950]|uniref:hypothetical protein n=1 Tax=Streptomyces sp. NPDC012950 TaxID=3364858 RepID=UPI003697A919